MTNAELTRIYNEANRLDPKRHNPISSNRIFEAMRAAMAIEREACANICDLVCDANSYEGSQAGECADMIRMRANDPNSGACRASSARPLERKVRRHDYEERSDMTHIDDWLDDPTTGPADVKEWLEHFRRPAIYKDYKWLAARKLFCTYKDGQRYRCIGCSRMGDVWLTKHFERENGYDLRIDIADCTDWEVTPNCEITGGR